MITVVIASYRYGHLAAQAIESVLSQTLKADRVLFVDDGAGDCEHLLALYPSVEFILRPCNIGIEHNFQDMLSRVTTDKCMFLGADNYLRPDTLELLNKVEADIVSYDIYCFGEQVGEFAKLIPSYTENGYVRWNGAMHGSSLYNTRKAQEIGYKRNPHSIKSEEDKMLFSGMIDRGSKRIHVNEPLLYYRRHKNNFQ